MKIDEKKVLLTCSTCVTKNEQKNALACTSNAYCHSTCSKMDKRIYNKMKLMMKEKYWRSFFLGTIISYIFVSYSLLFSSILSYSILCSSILFSSSPLFSSIIFVSLHLYPILFIPMLCYTMLCHAMLSHPILSYPVLS